jgi:energy-coupling factor transporter ATP-binding protein EcfA2
MMERLEFWITIAALLWIAYIFVRNPWQFLKSWFIGPLLGRPEMIQKNDAFSPPSPPTYPPPSPPPPPPPPPSPPLMPPTPSAVTSVIPQRVRIGGVFEATMTAPLPFVDLQTVASAQTVLVVGSRGSGKTVLIRALVGLKPIATAVFDPHNRPGAWPDGCAVIGGGSDYAAIYAGLRAMINEMVRRSQAYQSGKQTTFAPLLIAADEWGSQVNEAAKYATRPGDDPPGVLSRRWLKESRKFGGHFIAGAHGDTAASLGSKDDTVAFRQSFDYIVYTGAFVRDTLRTAGCGAYFEQVPMARTPENNEFPLIVPVFRPTRGDYVLLDMRACPNAPTVARPVLEMTDAVLPPSPPTRTTVTAAELAAAMRTYRDTHGRMPSKAALEIDLYGYTGGAAHAAISAAWSDAIAMLDTTTTTTL